MSAGKFSATPLSIPGVIAVTPRKYIDERGYFTETYVAGAFRELGIIGNFVQDNHSLSKHTGTIRGLHYQSPPFDQAKLVRVVRGSVFDVAVDLRRGSATYGNWCGINLTAEGGEQLFIPRGFGHGFCTLEPDTEVIYKVDAYYSPDHDAGIVWNDPTIKVTWPIPDDKAVLSIKDRQLPTFRDFISPFVTDSNA